ncbi:MAG: hypothetical protein ACRETT_09815, partial [Steroidobacteraceae bacterium]
MLHPIEPRAPEKNIGKSEASLHAQAVRLLEHRIELEALITSISTRFVSAEPEGVGAETERALGHVGRFIGADRALMYRFAPDRSSAYLVQDWKCDAYSAPQAALGEIRHEEAPEVLDYFLAKNTLNSP